MKICTVLFMVILLIGTSSAETEVEYRLEVLRELEFQPMSGVFFIEKNKPLQLGSVTKDKTCTFYTNDLIQSQTTILYKETFELKSLPKVIEDTYGFGEVIIDTEFIGSLSLRIRCYFLDKELLKHNMIQNINSIIGPYFRVKKEV